MSSVYHLQPVGQMEVVNQSLEMYLCCFCNICLADWYKWISWAQYCYITSWHTAIKITPFYSIFGRESPPLLSYVPGTTSMKEFN